MKFAKSSVRAILSQLARTLDWRFLVALAFLLLVAFVLVGGYQASVRKDDRIAQLIDQGAKDRAAATARAEQASRERDELLETAQDLERRLAALLAFLAAQGLQVPPAVTDQSSAELPQPNKSKAAGVDLEDPETSPKEQNGPRPRGAAGAPQPPTPGPGAPGPDAPTEQRPTPVRDLVDGLLEGLTP